MDPNQVASDKANRSGSTVFEKEKKKRIASRFSRTRVNK